MSLIELEISLIELEISLNEFQISLIGADPGFVEGGGGHSGYRERRWREGFWRVPFEDPLWNFKGGALRPPNPLVINWIRDINNRSGIGYL